MMEQTVYKIGEVSALLGLVDKNSNTLRSWVEEFGDYLSALANPAAGQPRRFTDRDVQVLTAVRDYRANHLTYDEIRERLRAGEHDVTPARQEPALPPRVQGSDALTRQENTLVPAAQVEALLAPLTASVEAWRRLAEDYRTRLEGREARIEDLERRIDELYAQLYARLDGAIPAALPAPAPNGDVDAHVADAHVADAHVDVELAASRPPDTAPGPGHGHVTAAQRATSASDEATPARPEAASDPSATLFPLPIAERAAQVLVRADGELPASAEPEATTARRRWWWPWA